VRARLRERTVRRARQYIYVYNIRCTEILHTYTQISPFEETISSNLSSSNLSQFNLTNLSNLSTLTYSSNIFQLKKKRLC